MRNNLRTRIEALEQIDKPREAAEVIINRLEVDVHYSKDDTPEQEMERLVQYGGERIRFFFGGTDRRQRHQFFDREKMIWVDGDEETKQ